MAVQATPLLRADKEFLVLLDDVPFKKAIHPSLRCAKCEKILKRPMQLIPCGHRQDTWFQMLFLDTIFILFLFPICFLCVLATCNKIPLTNFEAFCIVLALLRKGGRGGIGGRVWAKRSEWQSSGWAGQEVTLAIFRSRGNLVTRG